MGAFTSSLSWFGYDVATVDEVSFTQLTLATESDRIHSKGVSADVVTLTGNNGAITGKFNITQSGTISTTNAKIDVDLNIFHMDNNNGPAKPSKVTLSTVNAPVLARNSLYHIIGKDNHTATRGGNFSITVSTKNGPVDVSFAAAPVDSILDVAVGTTNGDSNVHLHPTFEGDLTQVTTNGRANIYQLDGIEDPSGRSRDRVITWKQTWTWWMIGWVGWGEKKQAGSLIATTTNGENRLYL